MKLETPNESNENSAKHEVHPISVVMNFIQQQNELVGSELIQKDMGLTPEDVASEKLLLDSIVWIVNNHNRALMETEKLKTRLKILQQPTVV